MKIVLKNYCSVTKQDIHVTDAFDRTPLETAEQNFKNDVAKLLRTHGKYNIQGGDTSIRSVLRSATAVKTSVNNQIRKIQQVKLSVNSQCH